MSAGWVLRCQGGLGEREEAAQSWEASPEELLFSFVVVVPLMPVWPQPRCRAVTGVSCGSLWFISSDRFRFSLAARRCG